MADINERMVRRERKALDKALQTPSDTRAMTGNPHPDLEQPDPRTVEHHEAEMERQDNGDIQEPGDAYILAHEQEVPKEDKGKTKYVVADGGIALQKGRPTPAGSVVALSDADARKFNKKGRLRPFFADPMEDPIVQAYAERSPVQRNTITSDTVAQRSKPEPTNDKDNDEDKTSTKSTASKATTTTSKEDEKK